jgi:uncharacterized MAPEG superfamily protein
MSKWIDDKHLACMTTELVWLTFTAVLAASLWIPYIVGVNITEYDGKQHSFGRPPDQSKMAPWIHRSHRAHLNLLEQFVPFATIVIVAHLVNVSTTTTVWCTILFFWLRIAHAIGMITGAARFPIRPILFTCGWLVTVAMAWHVLTHSSRI